MAAVMGRTEIGIRKTGSPTPFQTILELLLDCFCSCVEAENDFTIRRL